MEDGDRVERLEQRVLALEDRVRELAGKQGGGEAGKQEGVRAGGLGADTAAQARRPPAPPVAPTGGASPPPRFPPSSGSASECFWLWA
jgi:hypothetical protein